MPTLFISTGTFPATRTQYLLYCFFFIGLRTHVRYAWQQFVRLHACRPPVLLKQKSKIYFHIICLVNMAIIGKMTLLVFRSCCAWMCVTFSGSFHKIEKKDKQRMKWNDAFGGQNWHDCRWQVPIPPRFRIQFSFSFYKIIFQSVCFLGAEENICRSKPRKTRYLSSRLAALQSPRVFVYFSILRFSALICFNKTNIHNPFQ